MQPLIWESRPDGLRAPALVCAFTGWNDAGDAASSALQFIGSSLGATRFARIDPEEFFDFQATRPTIRLVDGRTRSVEWPEVEIYAARDPARAARPRAAPGAEPSMRWRTFCGLIVELAEALGVADGRHARRAAGRRAAHAPGADRGPVLRRGARRSASGCARRPTRARRASSACSTRRARTPACPTASLWASVPHYVAAAPNPKASLALVRKLEGLVGVSVDASELETAAADYERRVSLAVAERRRRAGRSSSASSRRPTTRSRRPSPQDLPSGDVLAREFQRFLSQRGPESGPGGPPGPRA